MLSFERVTVGVLLRKARRMGLNYRRVVIVGSGKTAHSIIRELKNDPGFGYRLMGIFDDNTKTIVDNFYANFWGTFDDLESFVRTNKIDLIYYTKDATEDTRFTEVMTLADELGVEFVYVPPFNSKFSGQFEQTQVGAIPCMQHTFTPLTRGVNPYLKRLFDLMVSVPFLIVSPIIFIPIAIAIKCSSPGPVFFKQKRTGIHGTEFYCYKFRSMKVNANADKVQATENDPRKTKVGDFLRRTSLDELPQFFNVFIGNMSVVGPRPHMVNHTEEYMNLINNYMIRHAVKPGITGWAQVNGYRGGTQHLWQMEKRVEYDVWYISNWNIFLDIKIVLKTIFNAFKGEENAY
jgi:putative colanic acid biosynthesis UDP-glucose lipid carrier transferase